MPTIASAPPRSSVSKLTVSRKAFPERWIVAEPPEGSVLETLRRELRLTRPFARILASRGYRTAAEAEVFLAARFDSLLDPASLTGMPEAVARIEEAIRKKQRIVLFGDYDADGVCSTALLTRFFGVLKYPVESLVPERHQGGYGLSTEALERIRKLAPDLLITLDNGIAAH